MHQQHIIETVLLLFLLYVYVCVCLCPENSVTEAFRCMNNITNGRNGSNVLAGTDTKTIRQLCAEGLFNRSISCIEELFFNCNQTKDIAILKKIANPTIWREGARHLCSNLALHAEHSDCIVEQRPDILSCLQTNDHEFRQNMENHQLTWKSFAFNVCRLYTGMRICTAVPVQRQCSVDVGNILSVYISSIEPPLCYHQPDGTTPTSSADDIYLNIYLLIVPLLSVIWPTWPLFL